MKSETKIRTARAFKVIGFLLLIAAILAVMNLFCPRTPLSGFRSQEADLIFEERDNSIDVVVLGHSGVYSGVSPMEMYERRGFTAYDCSYARQLPWESYKVLQAILKKQSPQVVVFEVDQLFYSNKKGIAQVYMQEALHKALPIIETHVVWKNWLPDKKSKRSVTKGYVYKTNIMPYRGGKRLQFTDKKEELRKKYLKGLDSVRELCEQKGIGLMLLELPSVINWDGEKYNAVREYAEKYDLPFVDANQKFEEMGFDWETDTRDGGNHLNHCGAVKLSSYLGDYLADNFRLTSRKDDAAYSSWNEDLEEYRKLVQGGEQ